MHSSGNSAQTPRRAAAVDLHIAGRLRLARRLAQMSQEQLAERVGVTFQQIQKYETGVSRISASRLYEIALVFRRPVSFFLPKAEGDEAVADGSPSPEPDQLADLIRSPELMNLNSAFLRIKNDKLRRGVLGLVRSIAEQSD